MGIEDIKALSWVNTNVQLRQDTDLGHLVRRIEEKVLFEIPANLTESEVASVVSDKLIAYLQSADGRMDHERILDSGLKLAEVFRTSFEILKGQVADEVSALTEQVLATAESLATKRSGFYNLDGEMSPTPGTFIVLGIEDLSGGYREALGAFMKKYSLNMSAVNQSNFRFMLSRMETTEDSGITEESRERIVAKFKERLNSLDIADKDDMLQFFRVLVTDVPMANLERQLFGGGIYEQKIVERDILACLGYLRSFATFKKILNGYNFDVLAETEKFFYDRLAILDEYQLLAACLIELTRKKYKDVLVIGRNILNGDEFDQFQKRGGTLEDISTYIRLHHNNNKEDIFYNRVGRTEFPSMGIPTRNVLVAMPDDRTKLQAYKDEVVSQLLSIKQSATRDALSIVLKNYIQERQKNPEGLPQNMDPARFFVVATESMNAAIASLVRNDQTNVEDVLYTFYLNTDQKDTLVSSIYYRMGAEAIQTLSANEASGDDIVGKIHATVMSDIVSSYLIKTFVVRPK